MDSWFSEYLTFENIQQWAYKIIGWITKATRTLFLSHDLEFDLKYPVFELLPLRFQRWDSFHFNLGTIPPVLELALDVLLVFIALKAIFALWKAILDAIPLI